MRIPLEKRTVVIGSPSTEMRTLPQKQLPCLVAIVEVVKGVDSLVEFRANMQQVDSTVAKY